MELPVIVRMDSIVENFVNKYGGDLFQQDDHCLLKLRLFRDASTGFVQWETKSVEQPPPLQTHRLLNALADKENMDILLTFSFDRKFYVFKDIELQSYI